MRQNWRTFLTKPRTWLFLALGGIIAAGLGIGINRAITSYRLNQPGAMTNIPVINEPAGNVIEAIDGGLAPTGGTGENGRSRLSFRLSQGQEEVQTAPELTIVTGDPLSAEQIQQILDRVPPLVAADGDWQDFNLPDDLIPPPLTGETIDQPFPPPAPDIAPQEAASGPLEVLRFAPEGEIPIAPFLNITFNQPMVPLTTVEALAATDVPVTITPDIPGRWQWVGTKTLRFYADAEAADRLPMATDFQVEIPAGAESASGNQLAQAVSWTFSTPSPQMTDYFPAWDVQPRDPLIFIAFDQLIDSQAVLNNITVRAGSDTVGLQLATAEEIEADERVSRLVAGATNGRFLVFRPQALLPADTSIIVTVNAGTPSAEGPRRTSEAQSFDFHTYSPLEIIEHRCGWYDNECPPLASFFIAFNNPIDRDVYDESMLQIDPDLPGASVHIFGNQIEIKGASQGRTDYRVRVSGELPDIFGQALGDDELLTFEVGSAPEVLTGPDRPFITLDPSATNPALTIYSINYDSLNVQAYAVEPADWPAYLKYLERQWEDNPPSPPGQLVIDESISVNGEADTLTETAVNLSEALDGEVGHVIVVVQPPASVLSNKIRPSVVRVWVQVTQIGLDAYSDHSEVVVWANNLQDGAPLSGARITLAPNGGQATTDGSGLARLALSDGGATAVVAQLGDDVALLPSSPYYLDTYNWMARPLLDELRWFVFDDRQMYRPGEEVYLKGWVRRVGAKQDGDVGLLTGDDLAVSYTLNGPQGNELARGQVALNGLGGFDLALTLPENTNLGEAYLQLEMRNGRFENNQHYHTFQIQEFRRPEFEVTARNETMGPYFVGDHAVVATSAKYFAGGPLPNADVRWDVRSAPSSYTPPNWSGFTFGSWTPWWYFGSFDYGLEEAFYDPYSGEEFTYESFSGTTDGAGDHFLRLDFDEANAPRPFSITADATVFDVNLQAWTAGTTLLVHPADLYVGIRSQRTFVERGKPLEIEAIVTDLDGNAVEGQLIELSAARLEWGYHNGAWREEAVDVQSCTATSAAEPVVCSFTTEIGGSYEITAVITDAQGRQNQSQFTRWVSGGQRPPARNVEQEAATLIPDKETYQPGDTAEILVLSPFSPAEGLLTISRSGIVFTERFQMDNSSYTLRIPIADEHIPNLNVQVDLVGEAPRLDAAGEPLANVPARPAFARGTLNLSIPAHSRSLTVTATAQPGELEPGGETVVDVAVVDANGRSVPDAELAVVVVDEAILALTNYQLADPLNAFYYNRPAWLNSLYGRSNIVLANPESLSEQLVEQVATTRAAAQYAMVEAEETMEEEAMMEMDSMAADGNMLLSSPGSDTSAQQIQVRSNFNPLAIFAPTVQTDGSGRASVPVQLPDNLTRYRVMVVAVAGGQQFGTAESNLTARLPLMVRPSAPRFLNFGDQVELPVVVQNQTGAPMTVDVVVQATNLELLAGAGQRITVPANDRVAVRFPATTREAGTARLQITAVSGDFADAATIDLPVYTPATTEAFATYGVIDDGAVAQPVVVPNDVFSQFGGLEIQTSSTALQALTDAVLYLTTYPYHHSEQAASRIMAVAALRDVLTAFEADGLPTPEEMETAVRDDIERLVGLQNYDGGFPIWERERESYPYHSIYVAHALTLAQSKGYDVPQHVLDNVSTYLRDIEFHIPSTYSPQTRRTLQAYALHVRQLMGDEASSEATALLAEVSLDDWSLEAIAWLWPLIEAGGGAESAEIERHLQNRVVETANAANFTTSYGDDAYLLLHSNRRTDGLILDALIRVRPESDLIPKVVNGLLAHRVRGRWHNTQENSFILLALDRYFNTFEAETPDFVARIWLGETYAGEHAFAGRTTERRQTEVPMGYLFENSPAGSPQNLIVSKEGAGRLYYRLGLSYAPTDLALDPLDQGFVVQRSYEAIDDPEDVYRADDGIWHIKAGARVRVRLTLVASNRRYHVALVDPLPAGLEIVNPALAVTGSTPPDPNDPAAARSWWWWWNWYDHQNMRDERAEAFATLLWEGVYDYSYVARATTPGMFVAPPTKAEEMYSPEVFGRSSSDWVIVE